MTRITIDIPETYLREKREICIRIVGQRTDAATAEMTVAPAGTRHAVVPNGPPCMLVEYVGRLVEGFRRSGSERRMETYASALNSFLRTMGLNDLPLERVTAQLMEDYERRLSSRGLSMNTTSFYLRILRAVYNRAVRDGLTTDRQPFYRVFTGKARTRKRALSLEVIRQIAAMEIRCKAIDTARWLFLFSYYTRGMSFVDIASLRKSDIKDGVLTYRRKKTGQKLCMAWRPEMARVAERVPSLDGTHLLGILDATLQRSLRKQCHARQYSTNESLKRLGRRLGLAHPLTMYVARHSWASIARQLQVPMSIISDGMGHHSERTTQIYLRSIDEDEIDKANDMMIRAVNKQSGK